MGHHAEPARAEPATSEGAKRKHEDEARVAASLPANRLSPLPARFDVGEQIVGSDHLFELAAPFNVGVHTGPAAVVADIEGDPSFTCAWQRDLEESGTLHDASLQEQLSHPIRVRFAPTRTDVMQATLMVRARWADGHEERQRLLVTGRARALDEAPTPDPAEVAHERDQERAVAEQHAKEEQLYQTGAWRHGHTADGPRADFEHASDDAALAARSLADRQHIGVDAAFHEVRGYRPPPVPEPLWATLAKFALSIACDAIADVVAKHVAMKVGEAIVNASIKKDSQIVVGLASVVKDAMKLAAKEVIGRMPAGSSETLSSDPVSAFLEAQQTAVTALSDENYKRVSDKASYMAPLLATDPRAAIDGMKVLEQTFRDSEPLAEQRQREATVSQWFAFKARIENGYEELPADLVVTDLDDARPAHAAVFPAPLSGLIDIGVDVDHGPARPVSAYAVGIAQAAADDVTRVNLADAHVPVRLILGWEQPEPTIVTRDESGRVRVSGDLRRLATFNERGQVPADEIQAERAARLVCDTVLARTLEEWHVQLLTDDQSVRQVKKGAKHVEARH